MTFLFEKYRPQFVYHAAAYKHVPIMEHNPAEAILTNVLGTKNVADLAVQYGIEKFVMVSIVKAVNLTIVWGASNGLAGFFIRGLNNMLVNLHSNPAMIKQLTNGLDRKVLLKLLNPALFTPQFGKV